MFYPRGQAECQNLLSQCLEDEPAPAELSGRVFAAIVPHAGWVYSGAVAGKVFKAISDRGAPATFILLGAVHSRSVRRPALYARGRWETPLGDVAVDEELADTVSEALGPRLTEDPEAHANEHSLEVQVPFIRRLFSQAKILPILVPSDSDAVALGEGLGNLLKDREDVVVIGSTDLTHYGHRFGFAPQGTGAKAHQWVREENDRSMVQLMGAMKAEAIIPEAHENHNACGAGAIAATVAAARARGIDQGFLLDYRTSQDVKPDPVPSDFVGYAGMIF